MKVNWSIKGDFQGDTHTNPQPVKKWKILNKKCKKITCYNCGKQGHISKYCTKVESVGFFFIGEREKEPPPYDLISSLSLALQLYYI